MIPVLGLIIICYLLPSQNCIGLNDKLCGNLKWADAQDHVIIVRLRVCACECNTKRKNRGSTLESARFPGALREESSDTESNQRVKVLSTAEI